MISDLPTPKPRQSRLLDAMRERLLVRFSTKFEDLPVHGYVMEVGPKFFMVAVVSGDIWFNGFECFRSSDIRDFQPHPRAVFFETALRKRGEQMPAQPQVSMVSIEALLVSANDQFPLVTIHREGKSPGSCWVGRVLRIEGGSVSLLSINPDATWDEKPEYYRLNEITRVNFGCDYEEALHLVGGNPPQAQ